METSGTSERGCFSGLGLVVGLLCAPVVLTIFLLMGDRTVNVKYFEENVTAMIEHIEQGCTKCKMKVLHTAMRNGWPGDRKISFDGNSGCCNNNKFHQKVSLNDFPVTDYVDDKVLQEVWRRYQSL